MRRALRSRGCHIWHYRERACCTHCLCSFVCIRNCMSLACSNIAIAGSLHLFATLVAVPVSTELAVVLCNTVSTILWWAGVVSAVELASLLIPMVRAPFLAPVNIHWTLDARLCAILLHTCTAPQDAQTVPDVIGQPHSSCPQTRASVRLR